MLQVEGQFFLDEKADWPAFHCHKKMVQDVQSLRLTKEKIKKHAAFAVTCRNQALASIRLAWSLKQVSSSCAPCTSPGARFFNNACKNSA
jgi:hypothetical protein